MMVGVAMIFFDIDGTLLDHDRAEELAAVAFYREYSQVIQLAEIDFVSRWKEVSEYYYNRFLEQKLSFQEQRRERVREILLRQVNDEEADVAFGSYVDAYKQNWSAYDDVNLCLQQLIANGHSLGVISNGDLLQQKEKLKQVELEHYFSCIVTSSEVGVSKPDREIFVAACNKADVEVERCYYIGDRLDIDALASIQAGMKGVWLNRKKEEPHAVVRMIHGLEEFGEMIE
ncbi:HAD family hydrolase [Halalkalibacter sp. AB-rgal2]|uniref:HAD family hydrolase n=1 Tax=Halalkalibacter sp. AB-rgal2 TaxID=3242695 RepID=UPI00359F06E7